MMEGLMYAWDPTANGGEGEWIPVLCDADGNILVDLSNVNLDDLADVNAPTPADQDVLTWDAATGKWIAQPSVATFDIFDRFREFIPWVSLDGFSTDGDGAFVVAVHGSNLEISTDFFTDNDAILYTPEWGGLLEIGKKTTVEFLIPNLDDITNTNIWLRISSSRDDPPTEICDHFGWKIIGADLYASNADGATQTITDTTVDLTTGFQMTRLKMVITYGTDCKFYVNGVLKATHTTNFTAITSHFLHFQLRTLEDLKKAIYLGRVLMEKEY